MSTKPLMLDGLVGKKSADDADGRELRRENQRLEGELREVRADLGEKSAELESAQRVIRNLRNQLNPLHSALRAVFGEIELALGEEAPAAPGGVSVSSPVTNGADPRWESYKATFPGVPARVLDALIAHREMSVSQLMTLLKAHYNTIWSAVDVLAKAGAVIKEGGKGGKIRLKT